MGKSLLPLTHKAFLFMIEIWKRYDERYEVSSFGNVRNEKCLIKSRIDSKGYLVVAIHKKTKQVHQLLAVCFLNHTPCGHTKIVDHIDNNSLNNNINNLQLISQRENTSKDKKTDFTGVRKSGKKFKSNIRFNGKLIHLGTFDTPQEASEQYQGAIKSIEKGIDIKIKITEYSSKFKGVSWYKPNNKWRAIKNKKHIGFFKTELEAHEACQNYSLHL